MTFYSLSHLTSLRELDYCANGEYYRSDISVLSSLIRLEVLRIRFGHLESSDIKAVRSLQRLRHLHVNSFEDATVAEALQRLCPQLHETTDEVDREPFGNLTRARTYFLCLFEEDFVFS